MESRFLLLSHFLSFEWVLQWTGKFILNTAQTGKRKRATLSVDVLCCFVKATKSTRWKAKRRRKDTADLCASNREDNQSLDGASDNNGNDAVLDRRESLRIGKNNMLLTGYFDNAMR